MVTGVSTATAFIAAIFFTQTVFDSTVIVIAAFIITRLFGFLKLLLFSFSVLWKPESYCRGPCRSSELSILMMYVFAV